MSNSLSGVWSAAVTPLFDDLTVNYPGMVAHFEWLLANGCDGVAALGTTGEANSFTMGERLGVIEAAASSRIAKDKIMIGTGCCALPDTIELTKAALDAGFHQILMLPPFYYKDVGDDALFSCFDYVIQKIGNSEMRVVVYDFPKMTGLEIGADLLVRLNKMYPQTEVGEKDSSGRLEDMQAVARAIPDFRTFAGTEQYLLPILKEGGAGCITATGNATSMLCQDVYAAYLSGNILSAEAAQEIATATRLMLQTYGAVPAMKELMAENSGNLNWRNMRPPILPLSVSEVAALNKACAELGFRLAKAA